MQAEYKPKRGNGFIVTVNETAALPYRGKDLHKAVEIKKTFKNTGVLCWAYSKRASRSFLLKLASAFLAVLCAFVFFHFFTFSAGVYHNGQKICIAKNKNDFMAALSGAEKTANESFSPFVKTQFSIYPVISLKKAVSSVSSLKNELLISSGSFVGGCSVYCGDTKIFDAESKSIAQEIVHQYISGYSLGGNAEVSHALTYKPALIKKNDILPADRCLSMLKESNAVSVVSVVNTTSSKVIPFETSTQNDDSLYIGETVTITKGQNGSAEIKEETIYENGSQQLRRIASEKVIIEPVNQIVKVGTKYKKVLKEGLNYPLHGTLSSPFGTRWGKNHEGIDIAVPTGTAVKASECGTVSYVNENAGGYGKFIKIDHGHGVETAYAHLSQINVKVGDSVSGESIIALSGNTGRSTGPHLHFEVIDNATPVDPLKYLKSS